MYILVRWRAPCKAATAEGLASLNIINNYNNNKIDMFLGAIEKRLGRYLCVGALLSSYQASYVTINISHG